MIRIQRTRFLAQSVRRGIHSSTPKTNPSPLLSSSSQYTSMKVASLKDECRKRGLRLGGRKSELIERLCSNDFSTASRRVVDASMKTAAASSVSVADKVRLISSSAPAFAQGDQSTIDFCKLPKTGLLVDAPRVKIPISPDAYGEVARYGTHSPTNDSKVASAIAEEELDHKQPQEIHYASGHQVSTFSGDSSHGEQQQDFSVNDKLVLGGIASAVALWWTYGAKE